jgi:hypothetical protein
MKGSKSVSQSSAKTQTNHCVFAVKTIALAFIHSFVKLQKQSILRYCKNLNEFVFRTGEQIREYQQSIQQAEPQQVSTYALTLLT